MRGVFDLCMHCVYVFRSERELFAVQQTDHTLEAAETGGKTAEVQEIIHRKRYYYMLRINSNGT